MFFSLLVFMTVIYAPLYMYFIYRRDFQQIHFHLSRFIKFCFFCRLSSLKVKALYDYQAGDDDEVHFSAYFFLFLQTILFLS